MIVMHRSHIGTSLESLFDELGEREEFEALTMKKIIVARVGLAMQKYGLNQTSLAARMHSKRPQVARLLDPDNTSLTIATLAKAAVALNLKWFDFAPKPTIVRTKASRTVTPTFHRKAAVRVAARPPALVRKKRLR